MLSIGVFIFSLPHLLSDEYLPMDEQESCNTECSAKLSSGKHQPTRSVVLTQYIPYKLVLFLNLGVPSGDSLLYTYSLT